MFYLIVTIHVIVSVFLIIVVLLQSGKAADLAGAFGGLGSQTVFGPRGSATVLTRATTISAIIFMLTSLGLSLLSTGGPVGGGSGVGSDILDKMSAPSSSSAPATPGKAATPAAPAPGGTPVPVPGGIQVTPEVNGQPGQTQVIEIPKDVKQQPADQKQK
jgi:preprotein translocase subunit SecG